jgi:hypothetical protein
MKRFWLTSEISVLKQLYPIGGPSAVHAVLPHRSPGTIRVIAHQQGVRFRHGTPSASRRWDADDDAVVALNFPTLGSKRTACLIDRTPAAVAGRAQKLGIRSNRFAVSA